MRAKVAHGPTLLTINPARAGPIARETLMPTLDSATAGCSSAAGTSSGVSAAQAGAISAEPMPSANVSASSRSGVIALAWLSSASVSATAAIQHCTPIR